MQLTIKEKTKEPLLSRTKISAAIAFENSTPSYKDVSAALAAHEKADEKLIVIRHIYNEFGTKVAKVIAYQYDDEQKKTFIEPKLKEKKDKAAKKKAEKK